MKKLYCVMLIIVILFLSACQSSQQIKPLKEESIDFDLNTAMEMVKKKEMMIIELSQKEKVSNVEYQKLEKSFTEEFGDRGKDILSILFINDMDAEPESDRVVNQRTFYPTVFHEGITVTKAGIYKSYYEEEFFNQTRLTIIQQYTGDNEKLKEWKREYIFSPNESEEWAFYGFSGVLNFSGEDFHRNYLELRK